MEENDKKKELEFKKSPKFLRLFKFIKSQYIDFNTDDNNKRLLFDLEVFMVILCFFSIIKTVLSLFYFFFIEKVIINSSIILIILQLCISFFLTKQNIIYNKFQKQELTLIEIGMKYLFIAFFCLEENMSIYYYNNVNFDLNPVFIYFIVNLILFFDVKNVKKFNETLIGLYIMNFFFLIYYFSLKNIMNFFLPINLVLVIFALINIISENFNKKIITMQIIHRFLEDIVEKFCHIAEFSIVYRGKCLYRNSKDGDNFVDDLKRNEQDLNFEYLNSEMSDSSYQSFFKSPKNEYQTISINNSRFKGFELILKHSLSSNVIPNKSFSYNSTSTIQNFLNFGLNMNLIMDNLLFQRDNNMFEQEEIENLAKYFRKFFKNDIIKSLYDKNVEFFSSQEKLKLIFLINYIDSFIAKHKVGSDMVVNDLNKNTKTLNFIVNSFLLEKIKKVMESLNIKYSIQSEEGGKKHKISACFLKNDSEHFRNNSSKDVVVNSVSTVSITPVPSLEIKKKLSIHHHHNSSLHTIEDDLIEEELNINECLKKNRIKVNEKSELTLSSLKQYEAVENQEKTDPTISEVGAFEENEDKTKNTKFPYKIKMKQEKDFQENKILCAHGNLLIYSKDEQPHYLKLIDVQLKSNGFKCMLFKENEKKIEDYLCSVKDCISKFCSKTIILELSDKKENILNLLSRIKEFEVKNQRKMTKILFRWDKVENEQFNHHFDYIFRLPIVYPDIQTIIKSLESD